ncbi:hypothetical protein LAZ67_6003451 [Cordylochernes scorpioides]|uniref:Transposase Tc1-like domain-containing protein n=1 Tax=Cordylochernes scorpioides TaxID=51811 RepID=A0ABY6KLM0_9ARAC|nr:hypothetical protein LAZ67_6003451 [Cordylochernes scorpioides]
MLEEVHGDHALSKSQCYRWFKKFQSGDFELDNEPRGKPHQKFEDAEQQALLDEDSAQTQEKHAKQLQVSQGAVSLRLNSLRMTQKLSRWVPHELSERQQERRLQYAYFYCINASPKDWSHYEHMSETGRAIGLKEAGWSNRLIARHLCRSDAAIRRCWQKWVNNGSMQRQDGSGRPRATTEREDRAIVRMAVAVPESTLSTIQRVTGTQVSKMTINRRLREWNLRARRPLRCLPLTLVHRQVRLQWCRERSTWNCSDWGTYSL